MRNGSLGNDNIVLLFDCLFYCNRNNMDFLDFIDLVEDYAQKDIHYKKGA